MHDPHSDKIIPLDRLLARQEKGVATPEQRRTILDALNAEPLPDGIIAPAAATGPTLPPPAAYVIHHHSHRCLACNAVQKWSEIYRLHYAKSRWDHSNIRHLTPVAKLEWNVPLHRIQIPQTDIPFCSDCVEPAQDYIASLPRPPVPQAVLKPTLMASSGSQSGRKDAPKEAPQGRARKTPVTLDDLMS